MKGSKMVDLLERWGKVIHRRHENWDQGRLLGEPLCIGSVSKILKGQIGSDRIFQECKEPKCVVEKQAISLFDCTIDSYKCDSEWSKKHIFGKLAGSIVAMYDRSNEGRGLHSGKFTIVDGDDRVIVEGTLLGICNAGTHHDPLRHDVERCNEKNRWLGQIQGVIRPDKKGMTPCVLLAEYAIDVHYEDRDRNEAVIVGTLEGVHTCECISPAD